MDSIKKYGLLLLIGCAQLSLTACNKDDERPVAAPETALESQVQSNRNTANGNKNGRDLYPDLKFIEASTLKEKYLDYTVVDVRSNYEYRVLRMSDSISIPATDESFNTRVKNLVRKHKPTVVLYSNGGKDRSAHNAARIALREKVENVLVFDGDIHDWAINNPVLSELNGRDIEDENKLIEAAKLNEKLLSENDFESNFSAQEHLLLDIRDDAGSNKHPLQSIALNIPLDHQAQLTKLLNRAKLEEKPLYVYDNYGLQVRWLMYQLDKLEIDNYHFLKDGVVN